MGVHVSIFRMAIGCAEVAEIINMAETRVADFVEVGIHGSN